MLKISVAYEKLAVFNQTNFLSLEIVAWTNLFKIKFNSDS